LSCFYNYYGSGFGFGCNVLVNLKTHTFLLNNYVFLVKITAMKKLTLVLLCISFLISCGAENSIDRTEDTSPYNSEEGKQALEDNGIAMLTKIDNFKDDSALSDIEGFIQYLITEDVEEATYYNGIKNKVNKTFINAMAVKKGTITPIEYVSRQTKTIIEEEEGLMEEYNSLVGNYTWDEATEDWNEPTENTDGDIVYIVTNEDNETAILKISNFSTITHESGEEVPNRLNISLKVEANEIFSHSFSADFTDGENAPNNMSNIIKLGALSFTSSMKNSINNNVEIATSLKLSDVAIIVASIGAEGEFTELNETGDSEDAPEDVFESANLTFTLLNATISVSGTSPETINENDDVDYEIELMNQNLKVTLAVGDKKIADGEFYKVKRTYIDYIYHNNPKFIVVSNSPPYQEVASFDSIEDYESSSYYGDNTYYFYQTNYWEEEVEEDEIDIRFIFADGTKSDMETYFEVGFKDIQDKVEEVVGNFEDRIEDLE
jgi:hypothetical protein